MSFNVDKCSVMHIGHNNMHSNYNMSNQQLLSTDQQWDLGIIITKDLKWQKQRRAAKWRTGYWAFIARNFGYKNKELILPLYKSLVRLHLEHSVLFRSPHLRGPPDENQEKKSCLLLKHLNYPFVVCYDVPKFHENRPSSF